MSIYLQLSLFDSGLVFALVFYTYGRSLVWSSLRAVEIWFGLFTYGSTSPRTWIRSFFTYGSPSLSKKEKL